MVSIQDCHSNNNCNVHNNFIIENCLYRKGPWDLSKGHYNFLKWTLYSGSNEPLKSVTVTHVTYVTPMKYVTTSVNSQIQKFWKFPTNTKIFPRIQKCSHDTLKDSWNIIWWCALLWWHMIWNTILTWCDDSNILHGKM